MGVSPEELERALALVRDANEGSRAGGHPHPAASGGAYGARGM